MNWYEWLGYHSMDIDTGEEILFGDDYDLDDVIWMGPQPTMNEFGEKCGIYKVMKFSKLEQVLSENIAKGRFIHYLPPYRAENKLILFNLLWLLSIS